MGLYYILDYHPGKLKLFICIKAFINHRFLMRGSQRQNFVRTLHFSKEKGHGLFQSQKDP